MANENEPAKLLLPYLQRADELQKHEPLVSYYCRLYAMERGLAIPQSERTKTTNNLLISLMKQLEKDKKSLTLGPDDNLYIEGFASNVFAKADKQDRAGRADRSTAKTFYAASIFFEILNHFGQVQPDLEQKQKYAAWKAADISKALKEGRKPIPGPPGGDNDLSTTPSNDYDPEPSRTDMATRPAPQFDSSTQSYEVNSQLSSNIPPTPPSNIPPSPPYPTNDYPSHNFRQPPSTDDCPPNNFDPPPSINKSENSTYTQPYQHHSYPQEPQHHLPHYQSHETPSYSYPNFPSYPSSIDSSLPAVSSHYPSYNHGSEASYSAPSASDTKNYPAATHQSSSGRNGPISEAAPISAQVYQYDSNYQPPAEKIAEAHKAARFAVGALAFDDVVIAVDHLKKSLELLTNPSAGQ